MASVSVLERMSPPPEETAIADFLKELAEKSAALLGYNVLLEKRSCRGLPSVLADVGVCPFTEESVKRYKAETAREANNSRPRFLRVANIVGTVAVIGVMLGALAVVISLFLALRHGATPFVIAFIWTTVCIATATFCIPFAAEWNWETVDIRLYRAPVPEFALQRAVEIKERVPNATFFIHQLVRKQIRDPLLAVRCGDKEYFIAVWDEPAFAAQEEI